MTATDRYLRFERVTAVTPTERGLLADLHGERLRVDLVRDDVVRVKISRGGEFDEEPTFAVCVDPLSLPVELAVETTDGVVRLRTAALVVTLHLDPFRLDVHRTDGTPVAETAQDGDGRWWPYATLNDAFVVRRRCRPEDAIYGLGEKTGGFNRRGRDFTLWNVDVLDPATVPEFTAGLAPDDPRADPTGVAYDPYYVSVPFFHHQTHPSGAVAASFVDNGYRARYEFSEPEHYTIHFAGGQYTEYLFAGPWMPDILAAYTWLTGRTPLPPLWSLAYHQCRWFRYTQDAVEQLAARHRKLDVPCDALWLDIEHMDGYRVFTWDTESFPDVPGMLSRLAGQGMRVITIVDPGVKHDPGYWVYDQAVERDVLCRTEGGDVYVGLVWPGNTVFPDFVTPEAREWWGELNAAHVRSGLAGIWNDMNEPATGAIAPQAMRFGRGRWSHERYHNQYALLMAMGTAAGLRKAMPELRTFVLSRAGFAGIQRYAANWLGDNQSRWDHLWVSMPMGMGLGVSGQPFVGADVGGFQGNAQAELFIRWMQYGTLTPFCRNHSELGNVDQYAWAFGDVALNLVREAIRLRYRLLPYLYAAFLRAAETGAPVQRPLVFDHQYDPLVRDLDDEYLLGPDLLVAPVHRPGTTSRQVYLPAGDWYDWHTGSPVSGGRFVVAATPMDRIPLYARAGAVVPMWPTAPPSTAGHHPQAVELHVFVPHTEGTFHSFLQEDDGLTIAAESGARVRTELVVARAGQQVTVEGTVTGDGYPEFRRTELRLVLHGARPAVVAHHGVGQDDPPAVDVHVTESGSGFFRLPNTGTAFRVEFEDPADPQNRARRSDPHMTDTRTTGVPTLTLNDGSEIPQLGFGVFQIKPQETERAVLAALEVGYRHLDTAEMYGNEQEVGAAVRASGLQRDEVFVTSKLNNGFYRPDDARRAFDRTLAALGMDHLDLFLIHWPLPTRYDGDYVSTWQTMIEFARDGRARSVGVSNFQVAHLERLAAETDLVPSVNQVEAHPYFANDEVRAYDQEHGIVTEAWSPIAQGQVLDDPVVLDVARRAGRTTAQVVLRWHVQRGDVVFPKSVLPKRMAENFALFDFELDPDDMAKLSSLDRGEAGRTGPNPDRFDWIPR